MRARVIARFGALPAAAAASRFSFREFRFAGFDGSADWNLLIRTFVIAPGEISFAAGGGITAASVPEDEYAESLHKAEGMLRAVDAVIHPGQRAATGAAR